MFYQVLRVFQKLGAWNHSMQYFHLADYTSVDACLLAATARYHNILAADLQTEGVTYNACYIIDNAGQVLTKDVFDRRTAEAETEE